MTTVRPQAGPHEAQPGASRPIGRPSLFDAETRTALLTAIRAGHKRKSACGVARVGYSTFNAWLTEAAADPTSPYAEFLEQVLAAESERNAMLAQKWIDATDRDWHATARYLAIVDPEEYSEQRLIRHTHTGEITVKHEHLLTGLDLDAVRGLLQPPADPTIIDGEAVEVPSE